MTSTLRLRLAATILVAIGMLTACAPTAGEDTLPASSSPAPPAPTAAVSVPVAPATLEPPRPEASPPTALAIPDLGVSMPVVATGIRAEGSMEVPEDPAVAGWYRFGPAPASAEGATVIAAHVDSYEAGLGPLAWLRDAQVGSTVSVTTADGAVATYVVDSVTYIPRAQLPVDQVFTRSGPRLLVVITCGGTFDAETSSYSDNVVLIASAVA